MYSSTPPVPPPKPNSHETSRISTPTLGSNSPRPPPPPPDAREHPSDLQTIPGGSSLQQQQQQIPDPGETWLPQYLEDKAKQDLQTLLSEPALLSALTHAPQTAHPSLTTSDATLLTALQSNIDLATHLLSLEEQYISLRASVSTQLATTKQLERQWRGKQAEMDSALATFSPASLYQRLSAGVGEQEALCRGMEESFLGWSGSEGVAGEKEVADWVRRYREERKLYYLRRERKERWDEGRVGGWR
ncbi:hypothetical protein DL546_006227 [Coniochaeta pulveracea]|uniref:VPS37 C-terminal domain-containing protein n=1 Tax=Coniochaeta pulveracea TaxID=177199 RepID=A0A420Y4K6_9PEZI|nr:hypothetical protein DL546_006227 [Coniochaeta pulveracea]